MFQYHSLWKIANFICLYKISKTYLELFLWVWAVKRKFYIYILQRFVIKNKQNIYKFNVVFNYKLKLLKVTENNDIIIVIKLYKYLYFLPQKICNFITKNLYKFNLNFNYNENFWFYNLNCILKLQLYFQI